MILFYILPENITLTKLYYFLWLITRSLNSVLSSLCSSFNAAVSNLEYTQIFCGKGNTNVHWKRYFFPRKSNQHSRLNDLLLIYSICHGNVRALLPLSDIHIYVIIRKLLDPIFYILLVSISWWESQIHLHRYFPHLVAYTRYDVLLFTEWMDFTRSLVGYYKRMMNWKALRRQSTQTVMLLICIRFESRPGHQLSWLTSFVGFISHSRRIDS
jgi:hypothetical protein